MQKEGFYILRKEFLQIIIFQSNNLLMKTKTDYITHLSKDKKLKKIIGTESISLSRYSNVCHRLCRSIMSQQLSTKVADVIHNRFLNLFNGDEPTPEMILKIKPEVLNIFFIKVLQT